MSDLRPDDPLDPGIEKTVLWLREHGFDTTDSGDGKATARYYADQPVEESASAMHFCCAILDFPHVAIRVESHELSTKADSLFLLLHARGVECGYNPADGVAYIFLSGVDDALLFKTN